MFFVDSDAGGSGGISLISVHSFLVLFFYDVDDVDDDVYDDGTTLATATDHLAGRRTGTGVF